MLEHINLYRFFQIQECHIKKCFSKKKKMNTWEQAGYLSSSWINNIGSSLIHAIKAPSSSKLSGVIVSMESMHWI